MRYNVKVYLLYATRFLTGNVNIVNCIIQKIYSLLLELYRWQLIEIYYIKNVTCKLDFIRQIIDGGK